MRDLIKETLADRFNLDNFTLFAKNFFNEINISPREIPASNTEGHIKKFTFLGEFSDAQKRNIDVLAVELTGDTKVERARGFQRNLIAKYLKDNIKDAGLVAFYSQDNPDWRLSFVKIDYKLTEKGVKVEVGTPPKRYSFLVGQTEPAHTAQKQLLPILEDHKNNPLVSEIEEAFSVEKVTKEFYEKYRRLFENLSKDLKKNRSFQIIASKENIDIDNFAKKLLGQIVFLYFLQKKGWLGVPQDKKWGEGDKFFLHTLFNKAKKEKKNFYDNYLEVLFYDTLNNPHRDETDPAYSRYFDSKIPFLNGGLFEPDYDWKNTVVYLEDDIFEDIIGTFDLYNFTVKEDEPLEKEVAVDPEMLGKVFENLLPENLRKGQGAYYTPREIVHYMCQESLINHLSTETKVDIEKIRKLITSKDNIISEIEEKPAGKVLTLWENETGLLDKALSDIKICDPACGSGAFLVGMLNEIVSARHILNSKKGEYILKKETIQNCIYGVDIDHGAVEIAKLRLWLSLVVDYELRDIEPLPNLDYKIMCGNSLLEELIIGDESIKLFDEKLLNVSKSDKSEVLLFGGEVVEGKSGRAKNEYLENLLKEKQRELLELNSRNQLTPEKKRGLEQEIKTIDKELNPKSKRLKNNDYHLDLFGEKAGKYFNLLKGLHKEYFTEYDPAKKKEKRKQIENIELEFIKSSIKEKVDEIDGRIKNLNMQDPDDRKKQTVLMKKKLEYMAIPGQIHESKTKPYFLWKLNFFEVFQEKGGFDVVIANPPYVRVDEIDPLDRDKFKMVFRTTTGKYDLYFLFFEKSFSICSKNSSCVFISPNKFCAAESAKNLRDLLFNLIASGEIQSTSKLKVFESVSNYPVISIFRNTFEKKGQFIVRWANDINSLAIVDEQNSYVTSIESIKVFPDSLIPININQESFDLIKKLFLNTLPLSTFLSISEGLRIPIKYESKSKEDFEIVKQYQFSRWSHIALGTFISKRNLKKVSSEDSERYKKIVCEKILIAEDALEINATIDQERHIPQGGVYFAVTLQDNLNVKYLLGILNSRLLSWMYEVLYSGMHMGGGYLRYRSKFLEKLPISKKLAKLCDKDQYNIIQIVEKILMVCKDADYKESQAKQAKVKEYERQIDQMVYKLYELTSEEIDIVENSNKGK